MKSGKEQILFTGVEVTLEQEIRKTSAVIHY